jgi:hypothetical protein
MKLISTENFHANIKRYEETIYETGLIEGRKKISGNNNNIVRHGKI